MKKLISAMLALAMVLVMSASAFAESDNIYLDDIWPVVKEPVDVSITFVGQNNGEYKIDDMWITQYWNDVTNLNFHWSEMEPSASKELLPLMFSTGDMPDAVLGSYRITNSWLTRYGVDEGLFYKIDDLLQYMPTFSAILESNPTLRSDITATDGHIYGLPSIADANPDDNTIRFFVNKEWLETLGMDNPQTLDELYAYLCAVRDNDVNGNGDPNDEVPFCASWNEGYSERCWILSAYGFNTTSNNTAIRYNEDGTTSAVYIPYTEQYKDYLLFMNKLWNEGLFDPDMFTQTQNQVDAKFSNNQAGYVGLSAPAAVDPTKEDSYICASILTLTEDGVKHYPKSATVGNPGMMVINADCDEEVAAALANFADSFYTVDMYVYNVGPTYDETPHDDGPYGNFFSTEEGSYFDPETGTIEYKYDESVWSSSWQWRSTKICSWAYPGYCATGNATYLAEFAAKYPETSVGKQLSAGKMNETEGWITNAATEWQPYKVSQLPSFFFTLEDQDRMDELSVLFNDYVTSMEAKFITGEVDIEAEYDTFVKTLEQYGVQEYVEILNSYYARYLGE